MIMPTNLITIKKPNVGAASVPLIISSPHSGRTYPSGFHFICPEIALRQTEDAFVDELVENAPTIGATVIQAEFPRSYIDVNRAEDDLDPALLNEVWPTPLNPSERTLRGLGLIRRLCKSGMPMYAAPLNVAEAQHRILSYYRPYHAELQNLLAQQSKQHEMVYLLDCHSMPSRGGDNALSLRPDFVIGNLDGTSCDDFFTHTVQDSLLNMGYSVALNNPYKGMEILRRYGSPQRQSQALQLEINRQLYLDEVTSNKNAGFQKLKSNLTQLFQDVAVFISDQTQNRMAAE